MKRLCLFVICAAVVPAFAQNRNPRAVSNFESLGLYYDHAAAGERAQVKYRVKSAADWRDGYPLVYDAREYQYRVSLVLLRPDTVYEISLTVILRGLELKNAGVDGVLIRPGVQHVVIEDCHITGWGRVGGAQSWGVMTGMDSGIYAENDAGTLSSSAT